MRRIKGRVPGRTASPNGCRVSLFCGRRLRGSAIVCPIILGIMPTTTFCRRFAAFLERNFLVQDCRIKSAMTDMSQQKRRNSPTSNETPDTGPGREGNQRSTQCNAPQPTTSTLSKITAAKNGASQTASHGNIPTKTHDNILPVIFVAFIRLAHTGMIHGGRDSAASPTRPLRGSPWLGRTTSTASALPAEYGCRGRRAKPVPAFDARSS